MIAGRPCFCVGADLPIFVYATKGVIQAGDGKKRKSPVDLAVLFEGAGGLTSIGGCDSILVSGSAGIHAAFARADSLKGKLCVASPASFSRRGPA